MSEVTIHDHVSGYPPASAVADPARLAMVREMGLLDSPAEIAFDRMVRLAAKLLDAPTSLVSIVDERRQFFKSAVGLDEPWATMREMPLSYSYCQYTLHRPQPLIINDARVDPLFRESPSLWQNGMVAYAGVPIMVNGSALGALCVIDTTAREWTPEQIEMLELLAASVTTEIQLRYELMRRGEIERMKDEFMSVVGHELRTPLTSIRASLGMLGSGKLGDFPPAVQQMFDVAVRNTDRLLHLLNDVIDVERLTTGRVEFDIRSVRLADIITAAIEAMQGLAAQANVSLKTETIDVNINADSQRMVQVFTNLLSNAIKFSSAGGTVHVDAFVDDRHVVIRVRDEGRGIPPDKIEAIFERFRQVESNDSRKKGGAGLGLAIVRGIVEQHGGTICAESVPSQGSTFYVRVPLSAE